VFFNLVFNIGSKHFAPTLQLGLDPTKKRPFFLVGTGFCIPSKQLAFSFGPLWTWDPTLDKLSVGQQVTNSTALENDIRYRFAEKPKGWYFGLQVQFGK
jgi:hypothetical protein